MTRPRALSNPNPRRPRLPYTYTPLPSAQHIRLLRLLTYDPVLSQAIVTLTPHHLSTITNRFTALSYTWGSALEPFETPTNTPSSPKNPHSIELIIVPPATLQTFQRSDDLHWTEGSLLDLYTPSEIGYLNVTGNLSDFFRAYLHDFPARHLHSQADGRRRGYEEVTQLWIDAVCIDQGSSGEKAQQIPLMGEIYSRAGRVLAWLGPEEARVGVFCWWHRVVWPVISRFGQAGGREAMRRLREGNCVDGGFWRDVVGFKERVPEECGGSWANAWAGYWAFYRGRRYFHRAWIVQEVVVAGRFEIMVGEKGEELSWESMKQFAFFLGHVGWIDVLNSLAGELLPPAFTDIIVRGFGITDIAGMQADHPGPGRLAQKPCGEKSGWPGPSYVSPGQPEAQKPDWPERWWAALSSVRRRDCFVKQDKVFATVGILQQVLPPGTPLPFPVDATATCEEVYTHAARTLLLNCAQLPLLSFIEHPYFRTLKTLPSWVPDLTTSKGTCPLGAFDTPFTAFPIPPSSPNQPPHRSITPTGALHLRGIKLDTIHTKPAYRPPLSTHLVETVLQFLAAAPTYYPHMFSDTPAGGQFREAALMHVLTCHEITNVNRGTVEETAKLSVSFHDWLLVGLGQVFAACQMLKPGAEEYSKWEERRAEVERLVEGLGTKVLVPGLEELREHGDAVARARKGEGEWPACVVKPQEFMDQVGRIMLNRCLFATEEGWWGVCSEACQVGDEVWLLEGGAVPYVLRPKVEDGKEVFTFCGECYVHGVMHGEFVSQGVEGKLQDLVIV